MSEVAISPEVEAINKVGEQIKGFEKQLGERASKSEIKEVKETIEDLKKNLGKYSEKEIDAALDKINKANEKFETQLTEMIEDVQRTKESKGEAKSKYQAYDPADLKKFISDTFEEDGKGAKTHVKSTLKMNGGL